MIFLQSKLVNQKWRKQSSITCGLEKSKISVFVRSPWGWASRFATWPRFSTPGWRTSCRLRRHQTSWARERPGCWEGRRPGRWWRRRATCSIPRRCGRPTASGGGWCETSCCRGQRFRPTQEPGFKKLVKCQTHVTRWLTDLTVLRRKVIITITSRRL